MAKDFCHVFAPPRKVSRLHAPTLPADFSARYRKPGKTYIAKETF
jgi:hypothetical protein